MPVINPHKHKFKVDGYEIEVSVHRAPSKDKAIVVQIDTDFEPNASDGSPGMRVLVNEGDVMETRPADWVAYQGDGD
jgi:hypothetical protein